MVDIHHRIAIDPGPDEVYAALATAAGLRGLWTADTMDRLKDHVEGRNPGPWWKE